MDLLDTVELSLGQGLVEGRKAKIIYRQASEEGERRASGYRLGLQLLIDSARPLSALTFSKSDSDWDFIKDKEELQELFADLLAYGAGSKIQLHRDREMLSGHLLAAGALKEQRQMKIALDLPPPGFRKGQDLVITFERYHCTYLFHCQLKEMDGAALVLSLPATAIRLLRRRTGRLSGVGVEGFTLSLGNPVTGEQLPDLPLRELNEQGGLIHLPDHFVLCPVFLSRVPMRLSWSGGGAAVALSGTICSVRKSAAEAGYWVGVNFDRIQEEGRRLLTAELIRRRRAMIDVIYRPSDHPKIWKLFDESHYLELKSKESFGPVFEKAGLAWARQQEGMDIISRKIMVRQEGEIMGHLQVDRAYPDAWMVHQLAIHPNMTKLLGAEIYSTVTDFISGRGIKYLVSSVDSQKAWNHRNYFNFIEKYPYQEHHDLAYHDLYEYNFDGHREEEAVPLEPPNGHYSPYDLKTIRRFFELQYSPLRRKALALDGSDLLLNQHNELYAQFGLYRKRDFVIYRENRQMLGFAVLESASDGINVCNLCDAMRVFFVAPLPPQKQAAALTALLRAGVRYYRNLHKSGFLLFVQQLPREVIEKAGFSFVYVEANWIADCSAQRRYEAFINTMYGRILAKRARLKGQPES